jgi:predicted translin family RNA/ssDNA-binding protein
MVKNDKKNREKIVRISREILGGEEGINDRQ